MSDTEVTQEQVEQENQSLFHTIVLGEKDIVLTQARDGVDLTIRVKKPTLKQKNYAETVYSKTYNRLLQDGDCLTSKELLEIAKKRGMWSDADETRLSGIDNEIIETRDAAKAEKHKKKKEELEEKLAELREEKFRFAVRLGQLTGTSIDGQAERDRYSYLLLKCVYAVSTDGEETHLYKNQEDLDNEQNMNKLERVLLEARSFWSGEGLTDFLHLED